MLTHTIWLNLIFENRNKQYGAYELRTNWHAAQSKGLIISIVFFTVFICVMYFFQHIKFAETISKTFVLPKAIREKYNIKDKTEEPIPLKMIEVELPLIQNWKLYSDKDFEKKQRQDAQNFEEKHAGRVLEEGVMKFATDPKTGKDFVPEKIGTYKGGYGKLYTHILNKIKFNADPNELHPHDDGSDEIDFEVNTMVWVQCELNKDGKLENAIIFKGASDPKFNDRVVEAIKSSADWLPAEHKGKKIKQTLIIPFHFYYMQPQFKYYN
ncbi:MAG: energy transducer TonB [Bacteroidetes bacterium]|nr:MAG: energy transducer TonB [Bacteroidota bacterium]